MSMRRFPFRIEQTDIYEVVSLSGRFYALPVLYAIKLLRPEEYARLLS